MTKLTLAALLLGAVAVLLSLAGGTAIPFLVPQTLFALALIVVLLNVMNESDSKRG